MEDNNKNQDGIIYIDRNTISQFTRRLSGKNIDGFSKVEISYQTYAMEDDEDSKDRTRIYNAHKAYAELSMDYNTPGYFTLDVIYHSYAEPELKMFWNRLQNFKRSLANEGEKTWIFYINILEKSSISKQTETTDNLLMCHIMNPILFYLTRETPNLMTEERKVDDELQGGNIIRMLIPENAVRFEITNEIDTSEIKGEVERELEEERYLNALEDNPDTAWDEL